MKRPDLNDQGFYSLRDTADYSSLNYFTIRRWAKQGKIRSKEIAGRVYVEWNSLAEYAELPPE